MASSGERYGGRVEWRGFTLSLEIHAVCSVLYYELMFITPRSISVAWTSVVLNLLVQLQRRLASKHNESFDVGFQALLVMRELAVLVHEQCFAPTIGNTSAEFYMLELQTSWLIESLDRSRRPSCRDRSGNSMLLSQRPQVGSIILEDLPESLLGGMKSSQRQPLETRLTGSIVQELKQFDGVFIFTSFP